MIQHLNQSLKLTQRPVLNQANISIRKVRCHRCTRREYVLPGNEISGTNGAIHIMSEFTGPLKVPSRLARAECENDPVIISVVKYKKIRLIEYLFLFSIAFPLAFSRIESATKNHIFNSHLFLFPVPIKNSTYQGCTESSQLQNLL